MNFSKTLIELKCMQKRMVYASLFGDKKIALLSLEARLFYIGLITLGDDDGRLEGDSVLLRSKLFPRDGVISNEMVALWLTEIIQVGLITKYDVNGEEYLEHPNWTKFQTLRCDRKKASFIPSPDNGNQRATNGQPNDNQLSVISPPKVSKDKISKDKIREDNTPSVTEIPKDLFGEFQNVKLTAIEYQKLLDVLPLDAVASLIIELDSYIETTPKADKKYKSHYATLKTWARRKISDYKSNGKGKKIIA